ncbi:TetR/AcrR family transcriptional regulator [Streptomyces zagrosensis]|uniref:AcrR family transcriptional regulator n=1 Tax=Streptomyces zagrosensis TaxID=1042984 RepID=A0A7W9V0U7_9ACTN|nr:AcrR family transcriptional regulator [Streptomyces zagrosensis]
MASARTTSATEHGAVPLLSAERERKLGLRERKKIQTRQAIRHAAYRLFAEQGYDATPIDQIAEMAEVSPSTVFRYFPAKEDIVLTDEYDPVIEEVLRDRPADEHPVESIRQALVASLHDLARSEGDDIALRTKLLRDVPAIRGRMAEAQEESSRIVRSVLAERTGKPDDDLELRVIASSILNALHETIMYWVDTGQNDDLEQLMHTTLDILIRGLTLSALSDTALKPHQQ